MKIRESGKMTEEEDLNHQALEKEFEEIANKSISCDHGTIDSCWSYGIFLEAIKKNPYKWFLVKYDIHARMIYTDDAKEFAMLENEFLDSG